MKHFSYILALCMGLLAFCSPVQAQRKFPSIPEFTKGYSYLPGFIPFYYDEHSGKLWLEIADLDRELLHVNALSAGVGSNDIGLDRGQLGGQRIVKFVRSGPKVLLIQPNYDYRANSQDYAERRSVEEAFAQSAQWGFSVVAESGGKILVEATEFLMQDAHGVVNRLRQTNQGEYRLDPSRSALYWPRTKNFPENTEFEAWITFTGQPKGGYIRSVSPDAAAVTVRQHHSFIKLPDSNYRPRAFDPRAGYFFTSYDDYASPIDEPLRKRYINRHRLEKKNPTAAVSEAVAPIVYYLDPGTPEPVRSALLDGARWWNRAFEAIGYKDAFQVKMLPVDADPLDVRYNVIQWVHRSTRGWSYGASVKDPRTGEIIKGHVSLGSLRVRQDYLIATGLIGPYQADTTTAEAAQEMALARLRQLSAHEIGHTLGLAHNFAASTFGRASVMDYPHPLIGLDAEGNIDLSAAYTDSLGVWDLAAIAYGYQDFPEEAEDAALEKLIQQHLSQGMIYITDYDSRALGGAHPAAHLWDNGTSAAEELERLMDIRQKIIRGFGPQHLRPGAPMALLEEVLVPIYLMHRYQVEAAAKLVGGLYYTYAVKGDGQKISEMLSPELQEQALKALLQTLSPEALTLPENLLKLIPPRPNGFARNRETFQAHTGLTFDPLAAAESAAGATLELLLHPERAARLVAYHSRDPKQPGLAKVIREMSRETIKLQEASYTGLQGLVARSVAVLATRQLMELAANEKATPQVRATALLHLQELENWFETAQKLAQQEAWQAHYLFLKQETARFLRNPVKVALPNPPAPPDGAPIGMEHACSWH